MTNPIVIAEILSKSTQTRDAEGGMLFDHAGLRPAALTQTLRDLRQTKFEDFDILTGLKPQ